MSFIADVYITIILLVMLMHASFIQRNDYFNGFVCYTNTVLTKYKKYELTRPKPIFKIRFTDMDGNEVEVQNFKLELMLEY